MQLGRYIKAALKRIKKLKEKRKKIKITKLTKSKLKSPKQPALGTPIWSCPVLEALPTEEIPIIMAERRPYFATDADSTETRDISRPVSVATTPEYRLETYRNVYLRLQDIGQHCGYDMVVDMLTILKRRQDAGFEVRFNIVDYDYDLPLGSRPNPLGRRVSLHAGDDRQYYEFF